MRKILFGTFALLALASCGDKMDYKETNLLDKDYITRNFGYVQNYMVQCYTYMDADFGNYGGAMLSSATDESEYSHAGNEIADFYNGSWSPSNPKASIWSSAYAGINYCNFMLEELQGLTFDELRLNADYQKQMYNYDNYKWEARWLRAYYYFLLVRQYGGVPLRNHLMDGDETNALTRATADEVFDFIDKECQEVAANCIKDFAKLGDMSRGVPTEIGRADQLAALALRARAALYHASPLFNTNNDAELWHKAATACKELLDACTARGKVLSAKYNALWGPTAQTESSAVNEWIFHRAASKSKNFETYNFPVGYQAAGGGNCPTQNLIDAYDMANGKSIDDATSGYDKNDPWTGRDPRLAMTVALNGDQWPTDYYNQTGNLLETFQGGLNGEPLANATPTGYYLKKYCNSSIILRTGVGSAEAHTWINFRLGEAYLNYAEAVFQYFKAKGNANAADAMDSEFTMAARDAASRTRLRAGIAVLPTGLDNDTFWARYQKERQVELAFEGHRFFDVRRWKEGAKWFTAIKELKLKKNSDGTYDYSNIKTKSRVWDEKMNLFPIPQTEIMKSGGTLTQNPGW